MPGGGGLGGTREGSVDEDLQFFQGSCNLFLEGFKGCFASFQIVLWGFTVSVRLRVPVL